MTGERLDHPDILDMQRYGYPQEELARQEEQEAEEEGHDEDCDQP